jgi:hypothetical protein
MPSKGWFGVALSMLFAAAIGMVGQRTAAASDYGFGPSNLVKFAQAGSLGGTIGKQDKSISGQEEQPTTQAPVRHHGTTEKSTGSFHCKLASVWSNEVAGWGTSAWTISPEGTAVERGLGNARGHATISGHTLTIIYHTALNNGTYVMRLNPACTNGSGRATVLGGVNSGQIYTAIFTATAAPAN